MLLPFFFLIFLPLPILLALLIITFLFPDSDQDLR